MLARVLCFFFLILLSWVEPEAAGKKRNFVVVLVDDLGWMDLGVYGSPFYETPRLDEFAKSAMRFTAAYASCPVCSPTRASLLTGKYPTRLGITDWIPGQDPPGKELKTPEDADELALEEVTLAEVLSGSGYRTFFAGKWHLGGDGFLPEDQGFDVNKGGHDRGSPPGGYYSPYRNPKLEDGPTGEYLPDRLTAEAMRFIEENRDAPFLVYLSFYTVHTPIQPSRRHVEKFRAKAALVESAGPERVKEGGGETKLVQNHPEYASMIHAMDENVGRLLDQLDELELRDDTVVLFTSDNGGLSTLPPGRRSPASNTPLRAGKGWLYEGGIRIPLMISAPGINGKGAICDAPVISQDLFPTMMELAGVDKVAGEELDGVSLVPLLRGGKQLERDALFWHYPHYHGSAWTPGAAVRAGDWKLIQFYERAEVELYNLGVDLGERNDLSKREPGKTKDLMDLLLQWQEATGAKLPRATGGETL